MYNHVIFIQNIYLFRNPPASTRPSALRRCGPPPRALLCIRNSDVEALCPQALLVSLDELHAVLMLGTLLRDACVPGTLAGRRQNKCKIQSRSVSCPNASGVTSRSLHDLSLSLSLSLFWVFSLRNGGVVPGLTFVSGQAQQIFFFGFPSPPPPEAFSLPPPAIANCLSHRPPRRPPTSALLALLALLAWESGFRILNFLVRGFGGGGQASKGGRIFFAGGGEGARARVCGAVRPRVQERDPFDPKP